MKKVLRAVFLLAVNVSICQDLMSDTSRIIQANKEAFQLYGVNPGKMEEIGNEMLQASKRIQYDRGVASSHNTIALAHMSMAEYEKALENFLLALNIYEKMGANQLVSSMLNNIGVVYYYLEDHHQSLYYHELALSLNEELSDSVGIAKSLNNIGIAHKSLSHFDEALEYYKESLSYKRKLNDSLRISSSLNNIGNVLMEQNNLIEAKEYFMQSLILDSLNGKNGGVATSYLNLGSVSIKQKQFRLAEKQLKRAIKLSDRSDARQTKMLVFEKLKELFEARRNYEKAFFWSEKSIELKDSLDALASSRSISQLESKYQNQKILIENDLLKEREKLKDEQINKQKLLILIGSFTLLLFIMLTYYFMKSYRLRQINLRIQKEKNEKILKQNRLILKQRDELKGINEAKNKMFTILSHDIKAPFNNLISFMTLASQKVLTNAEMQNILKKMAVEASNVSGLVTNILEWMKTQMDGVKVRKEDLLLHTLIEGICDQQRPLAKTKNIDLKNLVQAHQQCYGDKNLIEIIIRNLIGNAIKYTVDGSISVFSKNVEGTVFVSVIDTGIGIPENDIQRIDANDYFSTAGTADEIGTGIGLMLIKEFVMKNGGTLKIKSEVDIGSTFTFTVPSSVSTQDD